MDTIKPLARVALKYFTALEGRIRVIQLDERTQTDVAEVWWDDGGKTNCPVDRLVATKYYPQDRYPWEKIGSQEKPSPEDVQDKTN